MKKRLLPIITFIFIVCSQCIYGYVQPCFCDVSSGIQFSADWLNWKVRRSNLDFAIVGETVDDYPDGVIRCVHSDKHSGLRLAFFQDCGHWDFGVRWTGFCPDQKETIYREEEDIIPTRVPSSIIVNGDLPGSGLDFAESKYRVNMNVFDLETGFEYGQYFWCFTLRPFGGVRISLIDQKLDTEYDSTFGSSETAGEAVRMREQLEMISCGLYAGLETQVDLTIGVDLFLRTGLGIHLADCCGSMNVYDFSEGNQDDQLFKLKKEQWKTVSESEIVVGGQFHYTDMICADWTLQVGYEIHQWCAVPDFLSGDSNLGFVGLVLRASALY